MNKRIGSGAAVLAGALAATGLVFAPTASAAVSPTSATITASCGIFGGGTATLTATQSATNPTAATMTLTSSAITTPLALNQNSIASTLTMVNTTGPNRVFSGSVNPAMSAGSSITVGPLPGTVAVGDSLTFNGGSLKMVILGITITCTTATGTSQTPGPFVFS
ncbi:hypothetical protein [Streptomyces sp. NBC_00582]|uniref:hypothetical protein n=1 Tax=Streptomyces sp. NBC_00582 TaxID=2975783 RepID=UPI001063BB1D|nr:hypothetical protein [Streptomyces sp. NBC_00582]WUB64848.1 hypothetical protein OG852_32805 [Streptomyces sp. NBC_00582]